MTLPATKTKVSAELDKAYLLIYGLPGTGKSTTAASWPSPIFLTTERAHRHLEIFDRQITSWEDFAASVQELKTKDGQQYRTVVIDTVDLLHKMCTEFTCRKEGIEHPSEGDWGKAYDLVTSNFQREIIKLSLLGKGIIFISHAQDREVVGRNIKYTRTQPSMPKGCHKVIMPFVDIALYIGFGVDDVNKRVAVFEPREALECKDRFGRFPKEVYLPKVNQYAALLVAWNKGPMPLASQAAKSVAPIATAVRKVIKS